MYCEDLTCFLESLIYDVKTPASRWIIEQLRRKLPQDDVLCSQSGNTVCGQFLLCSPTGSCSISPRNSPVMGGTREEREIIQAGEGIPYIVGHFDGSFQFPRQKDFLGS